MLGDRRFQFALAAAALAGFLWLLFLPTGGNRAAASARGGDFTLHGADGPVALHDLRGKVVLLFFGYTQCPDVCPVSVAADAQALTALAPAELARTRLLFVSVDPERDTPALVKEYAAYFHPAMIGVTGSPAEIAAVAQAYGARYVRGPKRPDGSYTVDHTAATYVIAPDGRLAAELAYGTPVAEVVATVRKYLR